MKAARLQAGSTRILYNSERLPAASLEWLQPAFWQLRDAVVEQLGGRGPALALETAAGPAVLRRYQRGGWVAGLTRDRYLFTGFERSRSLREYRVLEQLFEIGLPVPEPLAASCERSGPVYRAGLLTSRIADAETLADRADSMRANDWERLGQTLNAFFRAGVRHADLNARNILCSGESWYLIDFDRARVLSRPVSPAPMLRRLFRSLDKLGIEGSRGILVHSATQ